DAEGKEGSLSKNQCESQPETVHLVLDLRFRFWIQRRIQNQETQSLIPSWLFFGFRHGIEVLVGAGLDFLHYRHDCLPRIFSIVLVPSRRIDTRQIGRPIVAEHLVGVAVARSKSANLGPLK